MSGEKKVILELSVYQAAAFFEILFREQKEYSYEFPPERIIEIREIIHNLDQQIDKAIKEK